MNVCTYSSSLFQLAAGTRVQLVVNELLAVVAKVKFAECALVQQMSESFLFSGRINRIFDLQPRLSVPARIIHQDSVVTSKTYDTRLFHLCISNINERHHGLQVVIAASQVRCRN